MNYIYGNNILSYFIKLKVFLLGIVSSKLIKLNIEIVIWYITNKNHFSFKYNNTLSIFDKYPMFSCK